MTKMWYSPSVSALALLLISAAAAGAVPQPPQDGWLAWQGCWRAEDGPADSMLCIVPDGDGVRFVTYVGGKAVEESRLVADAQSRPVSAEGCKGTEQAEWSNDGQRVFTKAQMVCGESMSRSVSGIMAMQSTRRWVSVQSVTSGGQTYSRVERYSAVDGPLVPENIAAGLRANRLARETARHAAVSELGLEDVSEAVEKVNVPVVVDFLTVLNQPFELDGSKLLALADAGMPAEVIDVLVAVSNPHYFAIETQRPGREEHDRYRYPRDRSGVATCWDSFYVSSVSFLSVSSYGHYDRCYGYGRYGYNPFGYYSRWGYDYYGFGVGTPVIIVRGSGSSTPNARVTRQGYTSGRNRNTESDNGRASSGTTSAGSSSSKPSTTSSGSSSGSSSSGSGRTAKPRDN